MNKHGKKIQKKIINSLCCVFYYEFSSFLIRINENTEEKALFFQWPPKCNNIIFCTMMHNFCTYSTVRGACSGVANFIMPNFAVLFHSHWRFSYLFCVQLRKNLGKIFLSRSLCESCILFSAPLHAVSLALCMTVCVCVIFISSLPLPLPPHHSEIICCCSFSLFPNLSTSPSPPNSSSSSSERVIFQINRFQNDRKILFGTANTNC